jgi:hypothetical protein
MRQALAARKRRKVRRLRERYPQVRIHLLVRRDLEALGLDVGEAAPARARAPGSA